MVRISLLEQTQKKGQGRQRNSWSLQLLFHQETLLISSSQSQAGLNIQEQVAKDSTVTSVQNY